MCEPLALPAAALPQELTQLVRLRLVCGPDWVQVAITAVEERIELQLSVVKDGSVAVSLLVVGPCDSAPPASTGDGNSTGSRHGSPSTTAAAEISLGGGQEDAATNSESDLSKQRDQLLRENTRLQCLVRQVGRQGQGCYRQLANRWDTTKCRSVQLLAVCTTIHYIGNIKPAGLPVNPAHPAARKNP